MMILFPQQVSNIQMQRSHVNQFKTATSGIFNSTLLGTHSMLNKRQLSPRNDPQMMASRIAHLPADSHPDLTTHPNMVIVFQSIEIQRLTSETDLLRGKLKQRQDRVINAGSYQVQIKELMERCNRLENQKYSYRQQLAQTKDMSQMVFTQLTTLKGRYQEVDISAAEKYKLEKGRNQELALEIDKWKNRYAALDRAKSEELESAKRTIQLHRESQLNVGAKQLLGKFEIEREELLLSLREKKEETNQKELELKKLTNFLQQSQIRMQEQEHSIEQYEQKVAMLSQQTYRLSEMLRAKTEEIRNLKLNENDLSFRLSQITVIDETKNKLNSKLKQVQENNQQLRITLNLAENQTMELKRKVSETQRLDFQLKQTRKEVQSKMKALERKDRRIMLVEEENKRLKKVQEEISSLKRNNQEQLSKIQNLQQKIDQKVQELNKIHATSKQLSLEHRNQMSSVSSKLQQYLKLYSTLETNYNRQLSSEVQNKQKSNYLQLQARQTALTLKEKDYTIASLESDLKQIEVHKRSVEEQNRSIIIEFQRKMMNERNIFEGRIKDAQNNKRQIQTMTKQHESRNREIQFRQRQTQYQLTSMQTHCRQLEDYKFRKEEEVNELKSIISKLMSLQEELTCRQTQISVQIRSFQSRMGRIQDILMTLKQKITERYRAAQENQEKLKNTQGKVQGLQEWFFSMAQRLNESIENVSPFPSPKKKQNLSPVRSRPFYSPEPTPTYQNNYAMSSSIYAFKDPQTETNISNCSTKEIPVEWLMKFVLLCVQVQSLRKKVGDKQAKMQSMRSSIASKNNSSSTLINGLTSSQSSTNSGFFTSRQKSLNRKGGIYY